MTVESQLNRQSLAGTGRDVREDFELACIQEFSHSGLHLGTGVSRAERRERIRAAILREDKADLRWRNSAFTYAKMYAEAYGHSLGSSVAHDGTAGSVESRGRQTAIEDESEDDEEAVGGDDGITA